MKFRILSLLVEKMVTPRAVLLLSSFVLADTCIIGSESSDAAISESILTMVGKMNKEGSFLGLVVPNSYEMAPLVESPSFIPDTNLPYLDIAGRRFRFGRIEKEKVVIVLTGLSMDMKLERCINLATCLPRDPLVIRVNRGISASIFISNSAYREFLSSKFNVTTIDMESSAVALVCL